MKIFEIKFNELPELNDEFAKDVSEFDTLEDYKKSIKKGMEAVSYTHLDVYKRQTSINVTKRHDLSIVYNSVIQCKLGTVSDLSVKIKMIAEVLKENPLDTKAEIDATDANRVYYRPEYK